MWLTTIDCKSQRIYEFTGAGYGDGVVGHRWFRFMPLPLLAIVFLCWRWSPRGDEVTLISYEKGLISCSVFYIKRAMCYAGVYQKI